MRVRVGERSLGLCMCKIAFSSSSSSSSKDVLAVVCIFSNEDERINTY